jgi:phospholipase C
MTTPLKNIHLAVLAVLGLLATLLLLPLQPPAAGATVAPTKVLTIVEENHSYSEARAGMPYLTSLANRYSYGRRFHAVAHPSLPNYIAIAGGSTFGVRTDKEPIPSPRIGSHHSVFGQALAAGRTARVYAQSMSGHCSAALGSGYAPKHNPWVYFGAETSSCRKYDVPAKSFLDDARANALPNAGMLVPDLAHDAHNGTLATADKWLKRRLPTVLASSDFRSGRLTVIVTFDEDDGNTAGNHVYTVVLNAALAGKHDVVHSRLSHYSITGYYEHVLGVPLRRKAKAGFARAFRLP